MPTALEPSTRESSMNEAPVARAVGLTAYVKWINWPYSPLPARRSARSSAARCVAGPSTVFTLLSTVMRNGSGSAVKYSWKTAVKTSVPFTLSSTGNSVDEHGVR